MSIVERYARALGVWWGAGLVRPVPAKGGWRVFRWRDDGKGHRVAWGSSDGPEPDYREIDEPTALLFEHTLASGESFDVGLCGDCSGTTVQERELSASRFPANCTSMRSEGWECTGGTLAIDGSKPTTIWRRPCPTCTTDVECPACHGSPPVYGSGASQKRRCDRCNERGTVPGKPTGRDVRTLARLMVEAMSREISDTDLQLVALLPGDPEAREHLATAADQLQLRGDPLGTWLALWLAGECPTCDGLGGSIETDEGWAPHAFPGDNYRARTGAAICTPEPYRCERCHGTGQALGTEQGAMKRAALDAMRATTIDTAFGLAVQP